MLAVENDLGTAKRHERNRVQSERFLKALQRHHGRHVMPIATVEVEAAPEIIVSASAPVDDEAFDSAWQMIENENRSGPIRKIQQIVAEEFGITRAEMVSIRRKAKLVAPRQIAMYLSRAIADRSFPEIGRRFGGRDHTTVLYAVRKIATKIQKDQAFAARVALIERRAIDRVMS